MQLSDRLLGQPLSSSEEGEQEIGVFAGVPALGLDGNQHQGQAILGLSYRVHPRVLLQLDYQSGTANSATAGFTYNVTPHLQFDPAVYVSNASGHEVWSYAVLTWNVDVFAPKPVQPPAPATLPKSEGQKNTPPVQ